MNKSIFYACDRQARRYNPCAAARVQYAADLENGTLSRRAFRSICMEARQEQDAPLGTTSLGHGPKPQPPRTVSCCHPTDEESVRAVCQAPGRGRRIARTSGGIVPAKRSVQKCP